MKGHCTIFESPRLLGKELNLLPGGAIEKRVTGQLSDGTFRTLEWETDADFCRILESITTKQALCFGANAAADSGRVVSEKNLSRTPGAFSRTKQHFTSVQGPTAALLDFDCPDGGKVWTPQEIKALLCSMFPSIADAGLIAFASSSSEIWQGSVQRVGLRSLHLYLFLSDGRDLQRFGEVLTKRLFLEGHGYARVSKSGAIFAGTIIDPAVFHPARLCYSGGSTCGPGLHQKRQPPESLCGSAFFNSCAAAPDLSAEDEARFIGLLESAKAKAQPAADAARTAWRSAREKESLSVAVAAGDDLTEARSRIVRTLDAALGGSLLGSFPLVLVDDAGNKETTVTVDQVLADRARYNLARCLDPLNPDHRHRAADGLLYLNQAVPCVFSLDDGGTVYRLLRQPARLAVLNGEKARLSEAIADALATDPDLFNVAGQVVQMQEGSFTALSRPLLHYRVGCRVALYRQGKDKTTPVEADQQLLEIVLALLPSRLRSIAGRACTPLVTTAGRIINAAGFDTETGIHLDLKPDECQPLTAAPTRAETVEALRRAWAPLSSYRWATPHDRAAMLATVLTIPLRPTIDAAPGLFADAASQASGKSKATGAVAAVVRGRRGGMKTWVADQEEELGKYLLSSVRAGDPAIVLDNITGLMRSASLATAMIEGKLNIRLLGGNDLKTPDARLMWLASGNNASLDRDMATRWLVARIDPGVENPSTLSFKFDPVEVALNDRIGIAQAAITCHLAWHAAGKPKADNVPTRFAEWGRTVRPLVQWLQLSGIAADAGIGTLGDPAHSILDGSASNDPESEALSLLLHGLVEAYGDSPFSAAAVRLEFDKGERGVAADSDLIFEGLTALMPQAQRGRLSAQTLNAVIRNRRGRIVGGLRVVEVSQFGAAARRGALWRVEAVAT